MMQLFKNKNSNHSVDGSKYIYVNEISFSEGKLHLKLEKKIDSIGFFDKKNNYKLIQEFNNENEVVLDNDSFNKSLPGKGYYGRRPIKVKSGNHFFELINLEILKQHVSKRYFQLNEKSGWISVYYFATNGTLKAAVLYSQNFHRSVKTTSVVKSQLIYSNIQENIIELGLKFYNKKRVKNWIENKKVTSVLFHDDAIVEDSKTKFLFESDILKVWLPIDKILRNGWLTVELFDGTIYESSSVEIDKVFSKDAFEIDNEGEVSHIRIGAKTKQLLLDYVAPDETDNFNMNIGTFSWKLGIPDFSIKKSKKIEGTPLISIIIPNWNNGPYLKRAMDSIVNQTISLNKIEIIFVDDRSSDNSLEIMEAYRVQYPNFKIVSLNKNTGGASIPRNVGLTLAKGKYVVLLDPDDWFTNHGIQDLVELLEKSGDAFAIGGMVEKNGKRYRKVFNGTSFQNGSNIDINTLPVSFYSWMGPQSIMIRHSLIKENNLHFPVMRTSDDQKFFFEAMHFSKRISQTKKIINFLNHDDDNISLMTLAGKSMEIFDNAIRLWDYLVDNNYNSKSMELLISRKLEIQFERYFYNSKMREALSKVEFNEVIKKFIDVTNYIGFDPSQNFEVNDHKIAWNIIVLNGNLSKGLAFIEWTKLPKASVPVTVKDGTQYRNPVEFDLPLIPYNFVVEADSISSNEMEIYLNVKIFNNHKKINGLIIRSRSNEPEEYLIEPQKISSTSYEFKISRQFVHDLKLADYDLLVLWDDVYYANIQYAKLAEYDYDSLRHDGFFKQGNRLGFRNHPVIYGRSIFQRDTSVELSIEIQGYYTQIKGLEFKHRKSGTKHLVSEKMLKDRNYIFVIELSELKEALPGGEAGISIIFDVDKTIRVPMYAMDLINVPNSGFIETQFHNLAFKK